MKKTLALFLAALLLSLPADAQRRKKSHFDTLPALGRISEVFSLIEGSYVDEPNADKLSEEAVRQMLRSLDPHSIYIPAKEVDRTNESLRGNFVGVGIMFAIVSDTISISDIIETGPADKAGMQRGDKIIRIDGAPATGDSINNNFVFKRLRGTKGTGVDVQVLRYADTLTFHLKRDDVPIRSIDSYFMVDDTIGYIRLLRFARNSLDEFRHAVKELKNEGMTCLILDLRGNGGGYLETACALSNEFISPRRLLVYQQGRAQKRQDFRSSFVGSFRKGRLAVLIDESSASASEIVSGAVQDWDRGVIIGRRSFGKGLVQRVFPLNDGGQIRLTTARYYTPSGRCIQKPYEKGTDDYDRDILRRYQHGELLTMDSITLPDSLKFKTASGRIVYGGGGILPDIFVPIDTTKLSDFYMDCNKKHLFRRFSQEWADRHRQEPLCASYEVFCASYGQLGIDSLFEAFAASFEVVRDSAAEAANPDRVRHSDQYMRYLHKALIANHLFGQRYYYMVMKEMDPGYLQAVQYLTSGRDLLSPKGQ